MWGYISVCPYSFFRTIKWDVFEIAKQTGLQKLPAKLCQTSIFPPKKIGNTLFAKMSGKEVFRGKKMSLREFWKATDKQSTRLIMSVLPDSAYFHLENKGFK